MSAEKLRVRKIEVGSGRAEMKGGSTKGSRKHMSGPTKQGSSGCKTMKANDTRKPNDPNTHNEEKRREHSYFKDVRPDPAGRKCTVIQQRTGSVRSAHGHLYVNQYIMYTEHF